LQGDCLEIIATFTQWNARRFGLSLRRSPAGEEETRIYFETSSQILYFDRTRSSLNTAVQRNLLSGQLQLSMNESLVLHIFLDRSVIEVFINEHAVFASRIYPTRRDSIGVTAFAEGGEVRLESLDAWNMRSTLL
jgi:sucrose-6-phosphate hydrolase SacC (GH32 family)